MRMTAERIRKIGGCAECSGFFERAGLALQSEVAVVVPCVHALRARAGVVGEPEALAAGNRVVPHLP